MASNWQRLTKIPNGSESLSVVSIKKEMFYMPFMERMVYSNIQINRADAPFGGIPTRDPGQLRVRLSERMRGSVSIHALKQRERALPPHRELARHDRRVVQPR